MVWNVAHCILTPYKRVVVIGLELARNELRPSFEGLQILLAKHSREVALDRRQRCCPNTIANDANRRDGLI